MQILVALLIAFFGPSTLAAPALPNIPEVLGVHGIARLSLRAALDGDGRPAFFWQGREVAPTIRVRPGDEIRVHYENALPQYCGLGMISATNLHFHGLTSSPVRPGDEVIATSVAPHAAFDYVIRIGRHQPPGLYWYHPHPHGLSNWQIGNGMAGAIVIEGIADELPQLAGLRERVIVLRDVPRDPSAAAALAQLTPRAPRSAGAAPPAGLDGDDFQGDAPCGVENDAQPTINGLPSATIGIAPNERQLWRILNASAQRHYDLKIAGVRMDLVALDGIPLASYAGMPGSRRIDHILIPPGGRAEVIVTGPRRPQLLLSGCYDGGIAGDVNPGVIFGELVDDRGSTQSARVAAPRGVPIPRIAARTRPAVRRTLRFEEDAKRFYINRVAYAPSQPAAIVARAGTTEEWTLENETDEVHVFHLHQVHFAVESTGGRTREWRDTIDLPPKAHGRPTRTKILVDFRDPVVRGTFLVHCHLADHEDGGMMAKVRVI